MTLTHEDAVRSGPSTNTADGAAATDEAVLQGREDTPWHWSLNWNEVRSDLLIGSCPMGLDDIERIISETGATAILSLQSDACRGAFAIDYATHRAYGEAAGLMMVNAPMLDFDPPDQRRNLPAAVRALTSLLAAERRVYVHCTAGCNRGPLAVLGYLAFVETMPPAEAIALIRRARPQAAPSWEAFAGARQDLVDALTPFIHVRAYYLHQQSPEKDAAENWARAEADVIRQAFVSPRSLPLVRLDPARA
jgi:predicted protein tyrosine phosphatase